MYVIEVTRRVILAQSPPFASPNPLVSFDQCNYTALVGVVAVCQAYLGHYPLACLREEAEGLLVVLVLASICLRKLLPLLLLALPHLV